MAARIDKMWRMRQSGATLRHIGDVFEVSGEWVRRLLVKHYGSTGIQHLLALQKLAELANCGLEYLMKLRYRGIIRPVKILKRKHTLWAPGTESKIATYMKEHPELCRICGSPLPNSHWVFCSTACQIEGGKFRNRPEAIKQRQHERNRRWIENHPEAAKLIERRKQKRYRARKARERYQKTRYILFKRCRDVAIPLGSVLRAVGYGARRNRLHVEWEGQTFEVPVGCLKRYDNERPISQSVLGE